MDTLHRLIAGTLDRIEQRLTSIAAASRVNAILSIADPSLVLPSPAVALMEVDSPAVLALRQGLVFRSLDPIGRDGDVSFTAIGSDIHVHPWSVQDAVWIAGRDLEPRSKGTRMAHGIRLRLVRDGGTSAATGPLSLCVQGSVVLPWAIQSAMVSCQGEPLVSRAPDSREIRVGVDMPSRPSPVHHHVMALHEDLLQVELPPSSATAHELMLVIHFEEPIPAVSEPVVRTNVVPVWNSMSRLYPDSDDAEQAMSETRYRLVHPLVSRAIGPSWRAWDVSWVAPAGEGRAALRSRASVTEPMSSGDYYLSFLPAEDSFGTAPLTPALSIVLSPEARRRMDDRGQRLAARFLATTGTEANGLPDGTAFELVDASGMPISHRVTGRLVGRSWGGVEGIVGEDLDGVDLEAVHALLSPGAVRTVLDATRILESRFGAELRLVDEWDLLRTEGSGLAAPLFVRVRFLDPGRPAVERRPVLRSCQDFLSRYLGGQAHGGIQVVDLEPAPEAP